MPKHFTKAPGVKANHVRRNPKQVPLGLTVTATDALGNIIGRIHRPGDKFHKTRKPGVVP